MKLAEEQIQMKYYSSKPRYFRPTEVQELQGDSTKAFKKFGWKPKISLEELIKEMVENDRKEALKELKIQK